MSTILEGKTEGAGRNIGIAVADFNRDITDALLEGCLATLRRHGVEAERTTVARVPGAFELPAACDRLAASGRFDAVIALGAVIRGETPHFDFVAGECARGVMEVAVARGVPVAFGVLTTDNLAQARARADREALRSSDDSGGGRDDSGGGRDDSGGAREEKAAPRSNKGAEAAETALRMASLFERMA